MDDGLQSKVALVTGGATGIGLATVRRLLAEGCAVMISSRNRKGGDAVVADLDTERVAFHKADVTDEPAVESAIEATLKRFGRLDYLFNNAGVEGTVGPMAAWSAEAVEAVLSVNVKGAFFCMKHAAPRMEPGSVIVNSSSFLGTIPMPLAGPYAASKAALLSLTRSAAAELAEQGISVFAICPAVVDTPLIERVSEAAGAPKAALAEMVCPSRQVTSPDRVADVVTGLLKSPTSFETGSALRIDPNEVERIGP
ncbi:SDR family oxidoreductase [Streptomyces sp. NPDC091371]|uniref:SDR family NAD(P)-dependent oxidoreductase n=1 Tax=Streptomyces sp. NPDC091371 TaxID=3155303 RepID=UPI003429A9B9